MPKAVTVTHVCHERVCPDCEYVTVPKQPGIRGMSLGPNLLAFLTNVWGKAVSAGNGTTTVTLNATDVQQGQYVFWVTVHDAHDEYEWEPYAVIIP